VTEAHSDSIEFICAIQKTLMYVCVCNIVQLIVVAALYQPVLRILLLVKHREIYISIEYAPTFFGGTDSNMHMTRVTQHW